MKGYQLCAMGFLAFGLLMGGQCSRARVESMNHLNEGIVYAQQQRHLDAVKSLERAGAVDPTNDQAFYNLALVHIEMRKFERAKEDLNRAIATNPEVAGYHEKLGTVLKHLEDWEGAKEAFARAIETDSGLFKAHFKLGQVLEKLDDEQNALRSYTQAIEQGPRFIPAYSELGRLYADLGYLDHASQVLREGLKVSVDGSDDAAQLQLLLGTVYQQQRKYDDAVQAFRDALEIQPSLREAMFSLGWTYALVGNKEEGHRYLKKFVDVAGAEAPQHYVKAARDRMNELRDGP